MAGGVYPRMNVNPADATVYQLTNITCVVCAYNFTLNVATNDHAAECPQCNFQTPTGY